MRSTVRLIRFVRRIRRTTSGATAIRDNRVVWTVRAREFCEKSSAAKTAKLTGDVIVRAEALPNWESSKQSCG